jgi:hypothetical protein
LKNKAKTHIVILSLKAASNNSNSPRVITALFNPRSDVAKIYKDCCQLAETGRKVLVLDYREKDRTELEKNKELVREFIVSPEVSTTVPV